MKVTIQKEAGDETVGLVDEEKSTRRSSKSAPEIKICPGEVNLEVGDGFRFGFGFILAFLLWSAIFSLLGLIAFELFNKII